MSNIATNTIGNVRTLPAATDFVNETVRIVTQSSPSYTIDKPLPKGFDPRLIGIVNPDAYGVIMAIGDVVTPIDVEWEAMQ